MAELERGAVESARTFAAAEAPLAKWFKERGRAASGRVGVTPGYGNVELERFHRVPGGATPSAG